jgi:allophanate hydrolase subunit 2
VAGGIAVEPVLGSRSTDILSSLGPDRVQPGTVLPVGPARGRSPGEGQQLDARLDGPCVLRCWPGPRADWFTDEALATLAASSYSVHPDSDRVGLRLSGPALERRSDEELPSEGLVLGAVQVPGDGRPLIFLNDHPTTGGYPVVVVVDPRDLSACAQLRPGDEVRFRPLARLSGAG